MKNFLKSSLAKVIITIILFIVFVPIISCDQGFIYIRPPDPSDFYQSILSLLISRPTCISYQILYIYLIIGLIISYLISCLITWFYNKFTKKP